MTKLHLSPCPSCARHVRVSEVSCPFCRAPLGDELRAAPAPRAPRARLSRGALYAFGASTLTLATACSGGDNQTTPDAATIADAAYGGPPIDGHVPLVDAAPDAAPVNDASDAAPVNDASDAGSDAPPMVDAAYGGPPIDSGSD